MSHNVLQFKMATVSSEWSTESYWIAIDSMQVQP